MNADLFHLFFVSDMSLDVSSKYNLSYENNRSSESDI